MSNHRYSSIVCTVSQLLSCFSNWRGSFIEGSLSIRFPRSMGADLGMSVVSSYFLAQLEDRQSNGYHEREEGELKGVPSLQPQNSKGERDQRHCLEEDED